MADNEKKTNDQITFINNLTMAVQDENGKVTQPGQLTFREGKTGEDGKKKSDYYHATLPVYETDKDGKVVQADDKMIFANFSKGSIREGDKQTQSGRDKASVIVSKDRELPVYTRTEDEAGKPKWEKTGTVKAEDYTAQREANGKEMQAKAKNLQAQASEMAKDAVEEQPQMG